jgi:hypothetical protein
MALTAKDMIDLVNTDTRSKTSFSAETAIKLTYPMYNLFIEFPTAPTPGLVSGDKSETSTLFRAVTFPAYINGAVSDTFSPSYSDAGQVFGRMDTIPVYQRTTRKIKVDFHIPAHDIEDARRIRGKLNIVATNCYPTYVADPGSLSRRIIQKPPLIRIKFGNIICNPLNQYQGLLGYLEGGITINHDLAAGAFTEWPGQEIYAKKYSLSLNMSVLHEFTPGFIVANNIDDNFLRPGAVLVRPGAYIQKAQQKNSNGGSGESQTNFQAEQSYGKNLSQRMDAAEKELFG